MVRWTVDGGQLVGAHSVETALNSHDSNFGNKSSSSAEEDADSS